MTIDFIADTEIYERVILGEVPKATKFLWLATSDLKDLYVRKRAKMVPFLEVLSDLVRTGASIRLLHAKEPGLPFQKDFDRYPNLIDGMERMQCPRVHFKSVVVDGEFAYFGSANLTGAGMGAKTENRRNFESGIATRERALVEAVMSQFDGVWAGSHCRKCGRKEFCTDFRDLEE